MFSIRYCFKSVDVLKPGTILHYAAGIHRQTILSDDLFSNFFVDWVVVSAQRPTGSKFSRANPGGSIFL